MTRHKNTNHVTEKPYKCAPIATLCTPHHRCHAPMPPRRTQPSPPPRRRHGQGGAPGANRGLRPGPHGLTFTEREWEVQRVLAWRLNWNRQQIEWYVEWENSVFTWEPNAGSGGYSALIYEFMASVTRTNREPWRVLGCQPRFIA